MMLTPCPDSFSKTLGTKEYLRTFDAGYTSFGPREYFSFASPWCLACWNSWKAWVLVIKCSQVPKVTLQWKFKCYYLSELSIQLFIFPRNLNSYFQTYSWWRRSSSAQWQLTVSEETWATSAPIQQVWLYLNSSRALCQSASHGQEHYARTCRDKNTRWFMSQDRDQGSFLHNGYIFWKAWHTCYQLLIHLVKTPEGILDINIRTWVFCFAGDYHIFWSAHALWFSPES